MSVIALRHGMFSHGCPVSDNVGRLSKFKVLESEARKQGKPVLTRGEMDGELYVMGWSKRDVPQACGCHDRKYLHLTICDLPNRSPRKRL